ncbi:MAG: hypothetical protein IIY70_06300 [Oscillospiraceae bacterium]|nr:hypothetical protein [Oscillospiraceae bacterium]
MKNLKQNWLFYVFPAMAFYALPPLCIGESGMLLMLLILPTLCLAISVAFGRRNGLPACIAFALGVAVLFIPTIFLFYNESAWIYVPIYSGIALLGSLGSRAFQAG